MNLLKLKSSQETKLRKKINKKSLLARKILGILNKANLYENFDMFKGDSIHNMK